MANEVRVTNQPDVVLRKDLEYTNAMLNSIMATLGWITVLLFGLLITVLVGLYHIW